MVNLTNFSVLQPALYSNTRLNFTIFFCRDAVRKSYAKINVEQNSNLSALLLAKVLYSIDAVSKEHSPDHVTVMNEYIGDVIMTSAEVLFECVINDLELNAKDKKLRGGKENNFTNDIILSSRYVYDVILLSNHVFA